MALQTFRAWVCRCTDGRLWPERPRHYTCADCGALIQERTLIKIDDALSYGAESIRDARPY